MLFRSQAIYYSSYEYFNGKVKAHLSQLPMPLQYVIISSLAGIATVLGTNPVWAVNTRQQLAAKQAKSQSAFSAFLALIKEEGVAGLWNGVVPALVHIYRFASHNQFVIGDQPCRPICLVRTAQGKSYCPRPQVVCI